MEHEDDLPTQHLPISTTEPLQSNDTEQGRTENDGVEGETFFVPDSAVEALKELDVSRTGIFNSDGSSDISGDSGEISTTGETETTEDDPTSNNENGDWPEIRVEDWSGGNLDITKEEPVEDDPTSNNENEEVVNELKGTELTPIDRLPTREEFERALKNGRVFHMSEEDHVAIYGK